MTAAIISLALLSFLSHLIILTAQLDFLYYNCFNDKGNYTNTSAYHTNLDTLLSNLTSDTKIDYGYYNSSYGQNPDQVNALGLCRGDLKPDSCRSCLNNAIIRLRQLCPNQKEAFGYYDECLLRYANRSMFGKYQDTDFSFCMNNSNNAADVDKYNDVLDHLMQSLRSKAAAGDSHHKFAARNATAQSQIIYGHVQCTPDLSDQDCDDCLLSAISDIPRCCQNKIGCRVIKLSCSIRYDSVQTSPQGNSNKSRTIITVVVLIGAFVALLILIFIYFAVRKSKANIEIEAKTKDEDEIEQIESLQLDFDTIILATDNFSIANKLGQGGFGSVYKGRLPDGQEVAIKRLSLDSGQGDSEFKNEVLLVAKLQHRNLVRLLGFCLERKERLLIYEFLPNRSLDYLLFDPNKRAHLNWVIRYKIIEGIARGLLYLHEDSRLRIIHRDLKASNILLDEKLNSKISDFGMARLFAINQTQSNTNRIVGTYGYMAPEYAMHGQISVKSDVFSFGILVLEIVSGMKNNSIFHGEIKHLLSFVWKNWREGTISNIIDPVLNNDSKDEILRCIHIGLLCVQKNVVDRPSMASVVLMLNSYSSSLPLPSRPPFLMSNSSSSKMHLGEYSSETTRSSEQGNHSVQASKNEASITELYPR